MRNSKLSRWVLVLSLWVSYLTGQEIRSIDQVIAIDIDGSASLSMDINFNALDSVSSLLIPAGWTNLELESFELNGIASGADVNIVLDRTSPTYEIKFSKPMIGTHKLNLAARIANFLDWDAAGPEEFKTYNWEVSYMNTLPQIIDQCELTILLPLGWNYHNITDSEPKFKKEQPKPPYIFNLANNRASVSISRSPMKYMESVGIDFAFKNEQKPGVLIWVGLLLCIIYLYYFRHLLLGRDAEPSIDTNNHKESK